MVRARLGQIAANALDQVFHRLGGFYMTDGQYDVRLAHRPGGVRGPLVRVTSSRMRRDYLLIVAAPALQPTSSCEPVPPEHPMAPISFPSSTSGMPPREAITSSSVRT